MPKINNTYKWLTPAELTVVKNQAVKVLDSLIKPRGIYASTDRVYSGPYHHYFGRDTAITTLLVYEAEKISKKLVLSQRALQALIALAKYQGQKDDPVTGEEKGKLPHEINTLSEHIAVIQKQLAASGGKTWFVDPADKHIKNWDSVDSTPLWLITVAKFITDGWVLPKDINDKLAAAANWCLANIKSQGGYIGWLPATEQSGRKYGGLFNQTWKDSDLAYANEDGRILIYPLHDVFSNAAAWSALNYSSKILKKTDRKLAKQEAHAATELEKSFNKDKKGFRIKRNKFYAEALDGKLQKLAAPSIDVGMSLAMDFEGRLIIPKKYQKPVVKKLVSNEFYDSQFGLRDYSRLIKNYSNQDQYHRGPQTYWPFTEALVAKGFINAGYKNCAAKALNSLLLGLAEFGSFVELFQVEDDKAVLWHNPATKQSSSRNQAWSAAAAYYASSYLLNLWESRLS